MVADWMADFDERERAEIRFAQHYAADYHHGTSGHLSYMVLAKLAQRCAALSARLAQVEPALEAIPPDDDPWSASTTPRD